MSLLSMQIQSSRLQQPRERIRDQQQHQQRHHRHNPWSFLIPLVFRFLREFRVNLKFSNLNQHLKINLNNQFRSEGDSEQRQLLKSQRFQRCFRTSRKSSPYWQRSGQCRSSGSSDRRRVASRSHTSGMVSRGSSGLFSRSDQTSHHQRAQADWSSRSWCIWSCSSQSSQSRRTSINHWIKVGHRSSPRERTQRSFLCKRVQASHFKGWQVCFNPSSHDSQAHFAHESDSFLGNCGVRHRISLSQYSGGSFKTTGLCSGSPRDSILRADCLASQTSALWTQRCTKIMAGSFLANHDQEGNDSNEVRFMRVSQEKSGWSCSIGSHGIRRWSGHLRKCSNGQGFHCLDSGRVHAQARQLPHSRESHWVPGKINQKTQEWQHHHGILSEVHWRFAQNLRSHGKGHHDRSQTSSCSRRSESSMRPCHSSEVQISSWEIVVDGSAQGWP